jgi:hypothetical protein
MVNDEFADEDFVRADLLALSQLELDDSGRTERVAVAVTFANRVRIFARHNRAVGLGVICATRGG